FSTTTHLSSTPNSTPLFLYSSLHPPDLHSFPTRRSSDLPPSARTAGQDLIFVRRSPCRRPRTSSGSSSSSAPRSRRRCRERRSIDRKSTRLNSSHLVISYAVFCLKKKKKTH